MHTERKLEFPDFHWRDCSNVSKEQLKQLAKEYGLSPTMVRDCLDPHHLPKIEKTSNSVLLLLRAFDENAKSDAHTVQESTRKIVLFWGENFLLTIHRANLPWLNNIWEDWQNKAKEKGAANILVHQIVEESLFTYEGPIDQAALAVEELEDRILAEESLASTPRDFLEKAYLAKKRAALFKRMIRLTRDLFPSLSRLGDPNSGTIQSLKEEADRLYIYSDDLVETTNDLVQLSISLTSNRTNDVVRVLTIVSIFLMPLNLVVGIYGMNFQFMPELQWQWGYPAVIGGMILLEICIYLILKKKGWIRPIL